MMDLGTYIQHNGRPAVRFERTYAHPIDRVWAAVSDPGEMAHWFPFSVKLEARTDGVITFSGNPHMAEFSGVVLAYEPPRRLAFTWGEDELYLDLESPAEGQCRLTLINVLGDRTEAARNAAGWSVCLGELDKQIEDHPTAGPHSGAARPWQSYYDSYIAAGMPYGAEIPQAPPQA